MLLFVSQAKGFYFSLLFISRFIFNLALGIQSAYPFLVKRKLGLSWF